MNQTQQAAFWEPAAGGKVACLLCYRRCVIPSGGSGRCQARKNVGGRLLLVDHGVMGAMKLHQSGYAEDGFVTYKPGGLALAIGGLRCTSHCDFCIAAPFSWGADALPWYSAAERLEMWRAVPFWQGQRRQLDPHWVITVAQEMNCDRLIFGLNEPLLTYEYTRATAQLARQAGLDVVINTNGFSGAGPVKELAPYVSAVLLGIKGSGSERFYREHMRAPGAMAAVKEAARAWRAAGVHLAVSDTLAPIHWQDDAEAEAAQLELFTWVAADLGRDVPMLISRMVLPVPVQAPSLADAQAAYDRNMLRKIRARKWASYAGLRYVVVGSGDGEKVRCANCGALLLKIVPAVRDCEVCRMPLLYCPWWSHEQHVTQDGRCERCHVPVPIAVLSPERLAANARLLARYHPDAQNDKGRKPPAGSFAAFLRPSFGL